MLYKLYEIALTLSLVEVESRNALFTYFASLAYLSHQSYQLS